MRIYSTGDEIFLSGAGMQLGETYLVYRVGGVVRHPSTGATVGEAVNLVGRVEVIDSTGDRALGLVTSACIEFEVGDQVQPVIQQQVSTTGTFAPIDPNRLVAAQVTDATVVFAAGASMYDPASGGRRGMMMRTTHSAGEVITIDQGRADGRRLDTPALFYEEQSESGSMAVSDHAKTEPIVVGQGIVFWLHETTATLLITDGDGAVRIGSRARPHHP